TMTERITRSNSWQRIFFGVETVRIASIFPGYLQVTKVFRHAFNLQHLFLHAFSSRISTEVLPAPSKPPGEHKLPIMHFSPFVPSQHFPSPHIHCSSSLPTANSANATANCTEPHTHQTTRYTHPPHSTQLVCTCICIRTSSPSRVSARALSEAGNRFLLCIWRCVVH